MPRPRTGRYRPHSFFDNPPAFPSSGTSTPKSGITFSHPLANSYTCSSCDLAKQASGPPSPAPQIERSTSTDRSETDSTSDSGVLEIEITVESRLSFAHYGYIYALTIVPRPNGTAWLISGSGDSDVKIWLAGKQGGLQLIKHFDNLPGAVHSFAVRDSLLYAGLQHGDIKVWDLETGACIRSIHAHEEDVLTLSVLGDDVYTAAVNGRVLRFDGGFDCTAAWAAHSGIILSSTIVKSKDRYELITAGNDSYVKVCRVFSYMTKLIADLGHRPAPLQRPRGD